MRPRPQNLVADDPSEECRCSIAPCIVRALAASQAKIRAVVRSVKEHGGVENQQLLSLHRPVQGVTVVNIYQTPATVPSRQWW